MATRNRTLVYIQYRNEKKIVWDRNRNHPKGNVGLDEFPSKGKLLNKKGQYEMDDIETGKKQLGIPPAWVSLIDDVNYDISRIKTKMNELGECHKKHLLPQFGVEPRHDEEQTIEILTEHITKMFQQAQLKIQRIGVDNQSDKEEKIKKNVQSALASQLQDLSLQFKKNQQDYLRRMKGKDQKGGFNVDEEDPEMPENFSVSFTSQQKQTVDNFEDQVTTRQREIQQIARSINDLALIFKDLAMLVIEQGTMLDRIDVNIDTTRANTEVAFTNIVKAQEYQKSYRNKLCMLLLCMGILAMIVALIVKYYVS